MEGRDGGSGVDMTHCFFCMYGKVRDVLLSSCQVCCKGHLVVLWIILAVVTIGVILGIILGVTVT